MARERYRRGGTAPNQVCICVDEIKEGEFSGKVYSRYSRNPWEFHSLIELLGGMESFYNKIAFPQVRVPAHPFFLIFRVISVRLQL